MAQVVAHTPRNADLPTPDQTFQSGRNVYSVAKDIAFFDHDITNVDPDPEAHLSTFRLSGIGMLQRALHLHCAMSRIEHTREFGKHAIPGRIRDPAAILSDEVVHNGAMG